MNKNSPRIEPEIKTTSGYKAVNQRRGNKDGLSTLSSKKDKKTAAALDNARDDNTTNPSIVSADTKTSGNKRQQLRNTSKAPLPERAESADETLHATIVEINTSYSELLQASPAANFDPPFYKDLSAYKLPDYKNNVVAKRDHRYKKPVVTKKPNQPRIVGTGDDKNFVVGLSLPLAFPLADQKATSYNINGGVNTVSDYLPVPHFQYHFNDKSYIQSEIQVISPQYIQSVLLYQSRKELPMGSSNYRYVTNSVFARKLYYFNFPVAVHYSPFKNFYLGTGLQFSSLLSGIAMYEERGFNSPNPTASDSLFSQQFVKFRNDSLSHRLNNAEFRLLLDANYYWKRFTVGLRYNQALSNYIAIRVTPTSPYFEDKNKSLQFYLRFNIWEDKKRKKTTTLAIK